jgi:ribosomal protein L39E
MTTISDQFTLERRARIAELQRQNWSVPLWIWIGALTLWCFNALAH